MQQTQPTEVFSIICAWCDRVLNKKTAHDNSRQSHTICQECLEKFRQEIKSVQTKSDSKCALTTP